MGNPGEERMEVYKNSCKKIAENNGVCWQVGCSACPFYTANNGYDKGCVDLIVAPGAQRDPLLIEAAQKFLDGVIVFHEGQLVEEVDE